MGYLQILSALALHVVEEGKATVNPNIYTGCTDKETQLVELNGAIQLLDDTRRVLVSARCRTEREMDEVPRCIKTNNTVGLETLPTEILRDIVDHLSFRDVEALSLASRRLREVCLPSLFRRVKFEFSEAGFEHLKTIIGSDVRHHVVSFKYVVPELFKDGKHLLCYDEPCLTCIEIMHFDLFKSKILTPDEYVQVASEMYDEDYPEAGCPPYMTIYHAGQTICQEQCDIVWSHIDSIALSSAFTALPRLREVTVHFQATLDEYDCEYDWLEYSYFLGLMSTSEKSYEHHVRAISSAIQDARKSGISIDTIGLCGFEPLHHYYSLNPTIYPTLNTLSECLRELLEQVQTLRLAHSESALELISHCTLGLTQLDMCHINVQHTALEEFLRTNRDSIQSIGFHEVSDTPSNDWTKLSASTLCTLLNLPQSTPRRADKCCSTWRAEGQRLLLLDHDISQRSNRSLAKRKFAEI